MEFRQSLVQQQSLKMNPQIYQSIKLMELPALDLREKIDQELERNPALEIIEDKNIVRLDEYARHLRTAPGEGNHGSEEHRRFIEGALTRPETLHEHLLWQLHLEPVDDELRSIAETLIQNLNDDGFHIENPETLFKLGTQEPPRLQEAMELVRGFEPLGTCTSDYLESLKTQARLLLVTLDKSETPVTLEEIEKVIDNLELLEKEKLKALAKKTGIEENKLNAIYEYIKKLFPFPGRAFAPAEVRYVIPDIRVIKNEDGFIIKLNDEAFPALGINPFLEELSESELDVHGSDAKSEKEARDFARENVKEARLFIDHLNRRNQTLMRVASAILEFQQDFFLNGPKRLAPLTLADIARELNVHETTVSRTANGKYMETDWGIFEIRYFFTNSISGKGSDGSNFSKTGVKEIIKEIIETENRQLSDQDISDILSKRGIALARRTVAKYRKELDMGSSYTRKIRD